MIHAIQKRGPIICAFLLIAVTSASLALGGVPKNTTLSAPQISSADNPREALKKTAYASRDVKSLRVRIGIAGASPEAAVTVECVLPDRQHMIGKNEEMIVVGHDAYRKEGAGPWRRFTGMIDKDQNNLEQNLEKSINEIEKADEVELIGRENIDGVPTLVYRLTSYLAPPLGLPGGIAGEKPLPLPMPPPLPPNKTVPSTRRLWIGEADALLRKWEVDDDVGSKKVTVVTTYYDYNADIRIERPEVPDGTPPDTGAVYVTVPPGPPSAGPGQGWSNTGGSRGTPPEDRPTLDVDQKPEPLNSPRPNYTEEARKQRIQGIVVVRVLVGADGAVKRARIVSGLPDGLNEEAIRTAFQMRFRPAMKDGKPVAFWHSVQIEFHL